MRDMQEAIASGALLPQFHEPIPGEPCLGCPKCIPFEWVYGVKALVAWQQKKTAFQTEQMLEWIYQPPRPELRTHLQETTMRKQSPHGFTTEALAAHRAAEVTNATKGLPPVARIQRRAATEGADEAASFEKRFIEARLKAPGASGAVITATLRGGR